MAFVKKYPPATPTAAEEPLHTADSLIAQLTQDSIPMTAATSRQKFREAFAFNYFSNQMPSSWSDPKIKEQLEVKISRTITDSLLNIRASEQLGSNP